jgi:hypothetical protein
MIPKGQQPGQYHTVLYSGKQILVVLRWCYGKFGNVTSGRWHYEPDYSAGGFKRVFRFTDPADAMHFKLTWGGDFGDT